MKGRPPKTTRLKLLQGTARADRTKTEPRCGDLPLTPPGWLGLGLDARRSHRAMAKILIESGIGKDCDALALSALARHHALLVRLDRELEREGLTILGSMGSVVKNPLATIRNDVVLELRRMAEMFAGTPLARSRVSVSGAEEEDPLEAFLQLAREPDRPEHRKN